MNTIARLNHHIASGNELAFITLLDKLDSKIELHLELQEKVDKLGNTPLEEEKIYAAIKNKDADSILPIIEGILTNEEVKAYKANEIGDFIHAVTEKITSTQNSDGTYKSTPNTKECDMPNAFVIEDILKALKKTEEIRQKFLKSTPGKREKAGEKFVKANESLQKLVFDSTGLDVEKLTDWEKLLVTEMTYSAVRGFRNHAQGKRFQS